MGTDLNIITCGVSVKDGCPVLRRIKAFIAQEGVASTLRYTFRNRNGTPINLDTSYMSETSQGSLVSESIEEPTDHTIIVKFREFTGKSNRVGQDDCLIAEGRFVDEHDGIVEVKVPQTVYAQCGIYEVHWGYVEQGTLRGVQQSLLSMERTLFGFDTLGHVRTEGPPTINEIRMQAWDSDPAEGGILGDVEFADEQIVLAMTRPIEYFNATNPPLTRQYDTRDFPWRHEWIDAVIGHLHQFAAAYYRRNRLTITAGGKNLDDLNREREYNAAADKYIGLWREFVLKVKAQENMRQFIGGIRSDYGRISGHGGW